MRQEDGLGALALAEVQINPQIGLRSTSPGLLFVFGKGHRRTLLMAVKAEDQLALLHDGC